MQELADFFNSILNGLFFLSVFGLICIAFQLISPSIKTQKLYRAEFFTDIYFWFLLFVTAFLFTSPAILHFIKPQEFSGVFANQLKDIKYYLKIVLGIVLMDFVGYWMHRLFHTKHLWKFHAIHHSPLEIDWLSSARFHPIETGCVIFVMYVVGVIFIGFSMVEVTTALTIRSWYGYFVHSNISWSFGKFGKLVATPFFHRWHHTTEKEGLDKNFAGVFAVWDYLFGTAYNPQGRQPANFGVGKKIGDNIWDYIKYPFMK